MSCRYQSYFPTQPSPCMSNPCVNRRGPAGVTGPTGSAGVTGPAGLSFTGPTGPANTVIPANTLFVAKSWSGNPNPNVYFTTISGALTQAATMSPSTSSIINIIIYSGTYTENLTLVSNANLSSPNHGVVVSGNVTWTPGIGVNAPQSATAETLTVSDVIITGTLLVDSTSKPSGHSATLTTYKSEVRGTTTINWRAISASVDDTLFTYDGTIFDGLITISQGTALMYSTIMNNGLTVDNVASVSTQSCDINTANVNIITGSTLTAVGTDISTNVIVATGSQYTGDNSIIRSGLLVSTGASANARNATFSNLGTPGDGLSGGTVDRSIWTFGTATTSTGTNTVNIYPPFTNTAYNVGLTQTSGTAVIPIVTSKGVGSFDFTDSHGGNTFDVTISQYV